MKKKIRIIPSTNTLKGIGVSGRNPAQNMMDLIDNSIDAMHDEETGVKVYHKQDVKIKWHKIKEMPEGYSEYENKEGWLITDQASGIKDTKNLWVLGKSAKKHNLGRYGFGVKTATLGLGNRIFIRTSCEGERKETIIPFEPEKIMEDEKWELEIEENVSDAQSHFTEIFITDCHNKKPKFREIYDELSQTYHKLISQDLRIFFNGKLFHWKEPDLFVSSDLPELRAEYGFPKTPKFSTVFQDYEIFVNDKTGKEHRVSGWLGILKAPNPTLEGVSIYWAQRKLKSRTRIGISPSMPVSRLYGQLFVDIDFPVNVHKTDIDRNDPSFFDIEKQVMKLVKPVVNIAERISGGSRRKISPTVKKLTHIHEKLLTDAINQALKELLKNLKTPTELNKRADDSENVGLVEEDSPPELTEDQKKKVLKQILKRPKTKKKPPEHDFIIPTTGEKVRLRHEAIANDVEEKLSSYRYYNGTLYVTTNINHPFYVAKQSTSKYRQMADLHLESMIFEVPRWLQPKMPQIEVEDIRDMLQRVYSKQDLSELK